MLWVSGSEKYFNSFSAGIVFISQNLTSKVGPRAERVDPLTAGAAYIRVFIFY